MFSGIGGFELGIQNALEKRRCRQKEDSMEGIKSDTISEPNKRQYANCVGFSEIDKYAIATYLKHFPEHKNFGDATKINTDELPDFDFLCGGFPCQAFSIAGKRRGFEDTRGTLFFEIARILKAKRPSYILLENVKGLLNHNKGETFKTIIQTLDELGYDVQWMVLNSKFFGVPQNRERVFIVGSIRGEPRPEILPFSECNGETKEKYKMETITMQWDTSGKGYNSQQDRAYATEGVMCCLPNSHPDNKLNIILPISPTLNSGTKQTGNITPKIIEPIIYPTLTTELANSTGRDFFRKGGQDIHGVAIMDLYNNKEHTDRSPALTEPHHNTLRVREGLKIRRLTPPECERLQGFPDNWTIGSDTQRYKQCGNAVTVNVIEAIIKRIFTNSPVTT